LHQSQTYFELRKNYSARQQDLPDAFSIKPHIFENKSFMFVPSSLVHQFKVSLHQVFLQNNYSSDHSINTRRQNFAVVNHCYIE